MATIERTITPAETTVNVKGTVTAKATLTTDLPAANIDRVVLVRPVAATHQTETEQRVIRLMSSVAGPTPSRLDDAQRLAPVRPGASARFQESRPLGPVITRSVRLRVGKTRE